MILLNAADTPAAARVLASCQASSARRDALTGLLGVFTGSPGAEGRLLAAWQAHDPEAEREIGARAATSLANWMVLSGRPDEALTWADRAVAGTVPGSVLRAMARTAQAYAFAAAGRTPEGLAVLGFLPVSGNEVPMAETDALIMRGMLKVYVDDLPGAIADLGVAAARLRTGLPATYPGPCLAHLSDAHFRRGDWDAAVAHAQLAISLAQDTDRPLDLARAHARLAQVLAFRGQWPAAQAHVSAARAAAERFPVVAGGGHRRDGQRLTCLRARRPGRDTSRDRTGARNRTPRCRGPPGHLQLERLRGGRADRLGPTRRRRDRARPFRERHSCGRPGVGRPDACSLSWQPGHGQRPSDPGGSGVHASPLDRGAGADAVRMRPGEPRRRPPLARGRGTSRRLSHSSKGPIVSSPAWAQIHTCRPAPRNWPP